MTTTLDDIFSEEELATFRGFLKDFRDPQSHRPGKWYVNPLNRRPGSAELPSRVVLRDITLRTIEQMPGVVNTPAERLEFLLALARAGVPEVVVSGFRRGHSGEEMRREVDAVAEVAPGCVLSYGNAVGEAEMDLAVASGYPMVQVWSATFLGEAMPVSAGAVYHRVWQGREWRDLRFPKTREEHFRRVRRLVKAGFERGLKVSATINLLALASEDYIADYAAMAAEEGAYELALHDTTGGSSPEALARAVEIVKATAPRLRVNVHAHNVFGLGIACSIAAVRAGAEVVEVSVNGYEVGPAGSQASLAGTATALEALYGVDTGIELSAMAGLAAHGERLTGVGMAWNEPVLGSASLESSNADEYELELEFDPLIHGSITPETLGAARHKTIGWTTGPLAMWQKLSEVGVNVEKEQVEPILRLCIEEMRRRRGPLSDTDVRDLAHRSLGRGAVPGGG